MSQPPLLPIDLNSHTPIEIQQQRLREQREQMAIRIL